MDLENVLKAGKNRAHWDLATAGAMAHSVRHAQIPLIISDPNRPDNPIVFANQAFLDLVGYTEEEIVGKNCRLLQGRDTTEENVKFVRAALDERRVDTVELVNYRKDGTAFINALQIGPILDDDGELIFFFGSQLDVTAKRKAEAEARKLADEELIHRLRNIVNVMSSIIRMSAREHDDVNDLAEVVEARLRALSDAHFETIRKPEGQTLAFDTLSQRILSAYAPQGEQQFQLSGPSIALSNHILSCVALCLHELATNSVKHGSFSADGGNVHVDWKVQANEDSNRLMMTWSESGGPAVAKPERSSGSRIIKNLIATVDGSFEMDWAETGLVVRAEFPL
ncbi:PAS domain-containing protein [Gymnodinialimonas sp. 57CJ19]|uniref:PAS domain-containing protein n=1 Tax=Gymnodinialimonas sp. 57CJ19 TaxID=3138498 RepID=UPI0031342835